MSAERGSSRAARGRRCASQVASAPLAMMIAMPIQPASAIRSAKTITPTVAEKTIAEYCRLAVSSAWPSA